jgi:hypothetical protein
LQNLATLLENIGKKPKHDKAYGEILPQSKTLNWLSFIVNSVIQLNSDFSNPKLSFEYRDKKLKVSSDRSLYLASERFKMQSNLLLDIEIEESKL